MLTEIKNEMSNFLTKEEAELILNRRYAMIDPAPYKEKEIYHHLLSEISMLKNMFNIIMFNMEEIKKKLNE